MIFRKATAADIPQIMAIRFSVRENQLADPTKVTAEDCRIMISEKGRGWACEVEGKVVGFSILDISRKNVWALFLLPEHEGWGIGKKLHNILLEEAAKMGLGKLWLSTDPGTRAEGFYEKMGWEKTGMTTEGEVRFERVL